MNFIRKLPDNLWINIIFSNIKKIYYNYNDKKILNKYRQRNTKIEKQPLVSIYIPTYNRACILKERAIKSVLDQTYSNFELIIVSDGSTDNTKEVVDSFKDSRIKYYEIDRNKFYRYPNKAIYHWYSGPVVAANFALDKLKGEWTARIDDDDEWTNDHVETLLTFAKDNDFEFVSSDYQVFEECGSRVVSGINEYNKIGGTQTWLYRSYINKLKYNIDCWRKKNNRVNDTDLAERFFDAGVSIGYLEVVTAYIRPRPDEKYVGSKAYIHNSEKYELNMGMK